MTTMMAARKRKSSYRATMHDMDNYSTEGFSLASTLKVSNLTSGKQARRIFWLLLLLANGLCCWTLHQGSFVPCSSCQRCWLALLILAVSLFSSSRFVTRYYHDH